MYETHFQLHGRPFVVTPAVNHYCPTPVMEHAFETLTRTVERANGLGILVGPPGTGKTLLCQLLAERFRVTFDVALLSTGRVDSRRALLQSILYEIKLPYRDMEEGELRLALTDHLQPDQTCPNGMLLIVDEAHSLSPELFEEIYSISNIVRNGQPRVRLVLAGTGALEERLTDPRLESLTQRIAARCYLEPLTRSETAEYVQTQVQKAGGQALFDESALDAAYRLTEGIPRLINQVCDHALVLAAVQEQVRITVEGIEEAWSDIQQLPSNWVGQSEPSPYDSADGSESVVIEFGQLDHEQEGDPDFVESRAEFDIDDGLAREEDFAEVGAFGDEGTQFEEQIVADPTIQLQQIVDQVAEASHELAATHDVGLKVMEGSEGDVAKNEPSADQLGFSLAAVDDQGVAELPEEEVVIDRYAELDANQFRAFPQVGTNESREIAKALILIQSAHLQSTVALTEAVEVSADPGAVGGDVVEDDVVEGDVVEIASSGEPAVAADFDTLESGPTENELFHPADDPVLPEYSSLGEEPEELVQVAERDDDQDIIIVEEDCGEMVRKTVTAAPRRQEYRQLFAKLRRG